MVKVKCENTYILGLCVATLLCINDSRFSESPDWVFPRGRARQPKVRGLLVLARVSRPGVYQGPMSWKVCVAVTGSCCRSGALFYSGGQCILLLKQVSNVIMNCASQ